MTDPYKAPDADLSNRSPAILRPDIRHILFSFEGRIGRRDFWLGLAIIFVASTAGLAATAYLALADYWIGSFSLPLIYPLALPFLYPLFAVTAKRYHDQGKSGWLGLIWLAPFVGWMFAIIECGFSTGSTMPNQYGPPIIGPLAHRETK